VDLSFNSIGHFGIKSLEHVFRKLDCKIICLNVENNYLNDKSLMLLVEALKKNSLIKILNLSQNYIGIGTCTSLKLLISSTEELNELYLHWCQIDKLCGNKII
jgi:Ran GTPase-activating protein (RanGAP) involved in mRNA processing and transport